MKIIKKLMYNGKEANLILLDDNITIDVVYDNKTLSSSAGAIWKNIKNDDWAQEALLAVEVESYLKKKSCKNRLQEAADAYF